MSKVDYDNETNILTVQFSDSEIVDSEVKDNVIIDYDANKNIVSIEILNCNLDNLKA
jgi:uncharacterized protein YuzE